MLKGVFYIIKTVCRRPILTSKDDPRTERMKLFLTAV